MKTKVNFSINYTTNFKPNIFSKFKFLKLFSNKKNNKLLNKNFFLFLLLIKYFHKNKFFKSNSLFIKPLKKKSLVLLRAPYRHKLARHEFTLLRYNIVYTFSINTNLIYIYKLEHLLKIFSSLKNFYKFFETNIVYQHKIKFYFYFNYKANFIMNNFIM